LDHKIDGLWGTARVEVYRSGQLEHKSIIGDHIASWADITFRSVLGHRPPLPQTPEAQKVWFDDKKSVKKYLKKYKQQVNEMQLDRKIFNFKSGLTQDVTLMTAEQATTANELDAMRTKAMLKAHHKSKKLCMGQVDCSPETQEPKKRAEFWHITIK
jgi:hypothetical protein